MIIQIGGTGFLGKHLCCELTSRGETGVSFSRTPDIEFLTNNAPTISGHSIEQFKNKEAVSLIENSRTLVYLASRSTPATGPESIVREIDANVSPAIAALDFATKVNPDLHVIYLSSGGTVYGPHHSKPISESSPTTSTTSYAYGKLAIENYIQFLGHTRGVPYTILRVSNPVGRWHKSLSQGLIGAIMTKAEQNEAIQIFGDGKATRDYIDADEVANAILAVANSPDISRGKIWNVGAGVGHTINEIIQITKEITPYQLKVESLPRRATDLKYNVLDCSEIKSHLNWNASKSIRQLIKERYLSGTL